MDRDRDLGGRRRQQGRPRPVQQVLPRLHAQAVGARPVGARRERDRARADAHQPRRPLLRRHLPGDAAARLHAHVREDAATTRTSRSCSTPTTARSWTCCRGSTWSTPARSTRSSTTSTASCPTAACVPSTSTLPQEQFQPVGTVNYPERLRLHPHQRVQAHHRAAARDDVGRLRVPARRGRPVLPGAAARERRALQKYEADAEALTNVTFVGRLATYKYYNMDQVVGQALAAFKRLQLRLVEPTPPLRLDVAA